MIKSLHFHCIRSLYFKKYVLGKTGVIHARKKLTSFDWHFNFKIHSIDLKNRNDPRLTINTSSKINCAYEKSE